MNHSWLAILTLGQSLLLSSTSHIRELGRCSHYTTSLTTVLQMLLQKSHKTLGICFDGVFEFHDMLLTPVIIDVRYTVFPQKQNEPCP